MKKSGVETGRVWSKSSAYGFVENHLVFVGLDKCTFLQGEWFLNFKIFPNYDFKSQNS